MKRLEAETKRFEEMKAKERKAFDDYKESEIRKLKKERRILDEYQRALKSMPNKKDREEIDRLRDELHETRSDLSRREVRWHSAIARLRTRIEELESERNELKGRINRLETERVNLQARINEARDSRAPSGLGHIRRASSSAGPSRQTLNSISQSLTLRAAKRTPDSTRSSQGVGNTSRSEQHRQFLASCRLSSRASSRSCGLESLTDIHARRGSTLTTSVPISEDRHMADRDGCTDVTFRPLSTASIEGARESVNSGGYFTGDDECQSAISEHAISEQNASKGDTDRPEIAPTAGSLQQRSKPTPGVGRNGLDVRQLPLPGTAASGTIVLSTEHADGSLEKTYSNGAIVLNYTNGSVKEIFPDKKTIVVSLFNGDVKRTLPDGRVIYHYAADGTVQITHPDGTEEINYSDGRQEIVYPKPALTPSYAADTGFSHPAGNELISRRLPNGDREIRLPNGQREIHSVSGIKCRIYPDGTTKTVFPDGRHETRYASGRLRIKDAQGTLILDTRLPVADHLSQQHQHQPHPTPCLPNNPVAHSNA